MRAQASRPLQLAGLTIGVVTGGVSLLSLILSSASATRTVIVIAGVIGAVFVCMIPAIRELYVIQLFRSYRGTPNYQSYSPDLWPFALLLCGLLCLGVLLVLGITWPFWIAGWVVIAATPVLLVILLRDEARLAKERTKTCPECAEKIKAAATKCRYCGHMFSAPD